MTQPDHALLRLRDLIGAAHSTVVRTEELKDIADELEVTLATSAPVLNADEQEAMDHLGAFMTKVEDEWGLRTNRDELTAAAHVLQGFVIQHMLKRLAPEHWRVWYASQAPLPTSLEDIEEHEASAAATAPITPDPGTVQS